MQKNIQGTEIKDSHSSSLDAESFIPIDIEWRKKYYIKVIKKRAIAFLLDGFFIGIPIYLIQRIIFNQVSSICGRMIFNKHLLIYSTFVLITVVIAFMESSKRKGTFGKWVMKIEITDNFGNSISYWRSLWRNVLKLITFFIYFTVIGFIIQIITYMKTKKLFHDKYSSTIIGERL